MLSIEQVHAVKKARIDAETLAVYYSRLAHRFKRRRRLVAGLSFFASSGFVFSVVSGIHLGGGLMPLSAVTTLLAAWSFATSESLPRKTSKLYSGWSRLAARYENLLNNASAETAQDRLAKAEKRGRRLSEKGTAISVDTRLLSKARDHVLSWHQWDCDSETKRRDDNGDEDKRLQAGSPRDCQDSESVHGKDGTAQDGGPDRRGGRPVRAPKGDPPASST
jgi:hypothetical protein